MRRLRASHPGLEFSGVGGWAGAFQAYCASKSDDRSEREAACLNQDTPHDAVHCSIRTRRGMWMGASEKIGVVAARRARSARELVCWASFARACAVSHPGGCRHLRNHCRHGHGRRKCSGIRSVPRLGAARWSWHGVGNRADNEWSSLAFCRCDPGDDRVAGGAGGRDSPDLRRRRRGQLIPRLQALRGLENRL
jgi:hypothetical protein